MSAPTPSNSDPLPESPIGLTGLSAVWVKRVGVLAGLLLLVGAIAMVWMRRVTIATALDEIREPSPMLLAILLASVAVNIMLSGVVFHQLVSRYGRVGVGEMQAVIASATLANYLPLRPGLFGRLAYHKMANDIPVSDSAKTVLQALGCTVVTAVYLAAALGATAAMEVSIWIGVLTPAPLLVVAGAMSSRRNLLWAMAARYVEVLVWAVRYWAAFALIGVDLAPGAALAMAVIAVITMMVPFVSNGLGLREWAIGLTAPLFVDQIAQMEIGITAELINRGAEIIVVTIMGLIGMAVLARMKRKHSPPVNPPEN